MKALYLWFSVVICAGCSIADKTTYEDPEGALSDTFFSDIGNGKTTQDWVEAQLGTPEEIQQGPGTQQIYSYRLARLQKKHAALLVILRYDGVARETEYFHVFFDNGIVKKHWRDSYLHVQVSRYFKQPESLNDGSVSPEDIPVKMDNDNIEGKASVNAKKRPQIDTQGTKKHSTENRHPYPEMKSPDELWPNKTGLKISL